MKKKYFIGIAVVAMLGIAAWNVNLSSQNNELSSISLTDIDAVADCEVRTNAGNIVILRCSGAGSCSTSYGGYTLTCSGTKH